MVHTVCVCVNNDMMAPIMAVLKKKLEGSLSPVVCGDDVSCFEAVKHHNDGIVMIVMGRGAHAAIKDLCDDYNENVRRVKLIYSMSSGVDAYQLPKLKQELAGIPFCNAQGCYSNILAEHVVFSMLYFNRSPWRLNASKREKKWDQFSTIEIQKQKVVIIGYGDIGQACGEKAAALGMQVTGIRRSGADKVDKFGVLVRGNDVLHESIRVADFVVGVLPSTEETTHFFNADLFAKMKPTAVFINIGRGRTQCDADVFEALHHGTIRAAALDVFEVEPLPKDSPLWDLPDSKLLLTAHSANLKDDTIECSLGAFMKIFGELRAHSRVSAYTVSVEKGY
ncbi:hypothetical protein JKF63_01751 [Porcisia hertigi]|uniref:D-isomer specific 2-hydroxyacid dehydrogenase NAD-binding domain-containing protein n=1 Tax=Porcisia hertigi TaxID=2761500 RepID=A0A836HJK4_9TRYP|nr:hypothetical protein JKF63_01751 [Porcisia hertigi]